jgi:hypothetical protein
MSSNIIYTLEPRASLDLILQALDLRICLLAPLPPPRKVLIRSFEELLYGGVVRLRPLQKLPQACQLSSLCIQLSTYRGLCIFPLLQFRAETGRSPSSGPLWYTDSTASLADACLCMFKANSIAV